MHYFKQNGTVMVDNSAMSKWGYMTFQGLIMDWNWYPRLTLTLSVAEYSCSTMPVYTHNHTLITTLHYT